LHVHEETQQTAFNEAAAALRDREQRPIRLIVLDTYSASMLGWDENAPGDASLFIQWCRRAIASIGCSILIIAHKGKDAERGTRGTSALEYGVDSVLDVNRVDDGLQVKLKVRHHRGAMERKAPFHFVGQPLGNSLVFNLLTSEQQGALRDANPYSSASVIEALKKSGALTAKLAVSTITVAANLLIQEPDEEPIRFEARKEVCRRKLMHLAREHGSLHRFAIGAGRSMQWALPAGFQADVDGLDD